MSFIAHIFYAILYQPLFNALIFLYDFTPGRDLGIAIILLTLVIRLALHPLSSQAFRAQRTLAEMQPKQKAIQEQFKGNKEEIQKQLFELYRKEKFNPLSAFLPVILQAIIMIALYRVVWDGFNAARAAALYSFIPNPGLVSNMFLGLFDLGAKAVSGSLIQILTFHASSVHWGALALVAFAGVLQFVQSKQAFEFTQASGGKKQAGSSMAQTQMLYVFPFVIVVIGIQLPAALGLYWVVTSLVSIAQQWHIMRQYKNQQKSAQTI